MPLWIREEALSDDDRAVHVFIEGGAAIRESERRGLERIFADAGISQVSVEPAALQRMSAGSGWILVALSLTPFINAILSKAGEDGYAAVKRLFQGIPRQRAGRPTVEVFDLDADLRLVFDEDLPDEAWRALVTMNRSGLPTGRRARSGHVDGGDLLAWNNRIRQWRIYPTMLNVGAPMHSPRLCRRLPVIAARRSIPAPEVPQLPPSDEEQSRWAATVSQARNPEVVANRSALLYLFSLDLSVPEIARSTYSSERLVQAVLDDVSRHGIASLRADHADTRAPWVATVTQQQEILELLARQPSEYGQSIRRDSERCAVAWSNRRWTLASLADVLVLDGVVEDISLSYLSDLLEREGLSLK